MRHFLQGAAIGALIAAAVIAVPFMAAADMKLKGYVLALFTADDDLQQQQDLYCEMVAIHKDTGGVYGNTDWAMARALHSAMLAAAPAKPTARKVYGCPRCGTGLEVDESAKPASPAQPEVQRLREALTQIAGEDYEAPHDADNDYISHRKSACITRMRDVARDALAASTGQEVES